jgi:hypothetical protein
LVALLLSVLSVQADNLLIIRGSDGTPDYAKVFDEEVTQWQAAATKGLVKADLLRTTEALKAKLSTEAANKTGILWLVLIGHGTFDGREARFNVKGPDFTSTDLAEWLKPVQREVIIVNTASASGAFIKPLSAPRRIIITATKSGEEVFYPRFGEFFARAINGNLEADLDQDNEVSLLEAFLFASKQVTQFYETEQRISTEHALIDDNGDGVGTRSELFEGTRPKDPKFDGGRAHQLALVHNEEELKLSPEIRAQRDALEVKVRDLINKRSLMKEDEYYRQLEALFLQIAKLSVVRNQTGSATRVPSEAK